MSSLRFQLIREPNQHELRERNEGILSFIFISEETVWTARGTSCSYLVGLLSFGSRDTYKLLYLTMPMLLVA